MLVYTVIRTVTKSEFPDLQEDVPAGSTVYLVPGTTNSPEQDFSVLVTYKYNEGPRFSLPTNVLELDYNLSD